MEDDRFGEGDDGFGGGNGRCGGIDFWLWYVWVLWGEERVGKVVDGGFGSEERELEVVWWVDVFEFWYDLEKWW